MKQLKGIFLSAGLALWLASAPAMAVLPDPVAYGHAVELGDLRSVGQWLDEGLDPDFFADRIGNGLMIAAWNGNVEMMALFVKRGANLNRANRHGEQALQLAAWNGHTAAVKWLLGRGAGLNREGKNWSALHYAVFGGHEALAKYLVQQGADVNARTPNDSTALMLSAREGHEALAKFLLDNGADPRLANDWGDTALSWAMRHEQLKIAQLVASPAAFASAVKAPPESFGKPVRSALAPSEIDEILRQIRLAEAEGRPVEALKKSLADAIAKFRQQSRSVTVGGKPWSRPLPPKALVITAKRPVQGGAPAGGERAELVYGKATPAASGAIDRPAQPAGRPSGVSEILYQLRRAEAEGRPTAELQQQLFDAVGKMNAGGDAGINAKSGATAR